MCSRADLGGGRGAGERGQHPSQVHCGRGEGQSGASTTGWGGGSPGATGMEPSRGWVGTKPREGLRPSAWSPLEGPSKRAEFLFIVHSHLVFGWSLTAV